MEIYSDLKQKKGSGTVFDRLESVALNQLENIKSQTASSTNDYLSFLQEIGFGELGQSSFMIYDGLVKAEEVFGTARENIKDILLFGDDMQGFNVGFDVRDWSVVEIDPTNMTTVVIAKNFEGFIRNKISELEAN